MRTQQEIITHYQQESKSDFFGFMADVLLPYLSAKQVKPFLKDDADLSEWKQSPLTDEAITAEMEKYMGFAWTKVQAHRGISASRSVEKMQAWLWLLGDEETLAYAKDNANYPQYGAPILMKICEKYGFPSPNDPGIRNMAMGKLCYFGCEEGCGKGPITR
jgi:hypothetical protein